MMKYPSKSPSPARFLCTARQFTFAAVGCGAVLLLAGCSTEPDSHLVSAPPPSVQPGTTLTTTTTTTPVAVAVPVYPGSMPAAPVVSTIVVTQTPPALRQEVVLAQPTPEHVWIPGFWTWRNSEYQWMAGHWELPPSSGSVWVAPRWEQQGNAYRFYEGYWS